MVEVIDLTGDDSDQNAAGTSKTPPKEMRAKTPVCPICWTDYQTLLDEGVYMHIIKRCGHVICKTCLDKKNFCQAGGPCFLCRKPSNRPAGNHTCKVFLELQ